MRAIYKREVGAYFKTMQGYVYLASFVCFTGIFFSVSNIAGGYNDFTVYVFSNFYYMLVVFGLMVPFLTMRLFAEEKKNKTDQLLLTAPIQTWKIVLGKYLASTTVFLTGLAITLIFPMIISILGDYPLDYVVVGYSGVVFYGLCLLAVGTLVSSLTEEPVLALIVTAMVSFFDLFSQAWMRLLPSGIVPGFIFFGLIVVGIAVLFYADTGKWQIAAIVFFIGIGVVVGLYFLMQEWFIYGLTNTLSWLSMEHHYENFLNGIVNASSIAYLLTLTAVLLFMATQVIARRRWR